MPRGKLWRVQISSASRKALVTFLLAAVVVRGVLFPGYGGGPLQLFFVLVVFSILVGALCSAVMKVSFPFSPIRILGFSILSLSIAEALSVAVHYAKTGLHFGNDPDSLVIFFYIYAAQLCVITLTTLVIWLISTSRQRKQKNHVNLKTQGSTRSHLGE